MSPVQSQLVKLELLDPRECHYTFRRPCDFAADSRMILQRSEDLCKAPHLCDVQFLPSTEECSQASAWHWAYRQHVESRRAFDLRHWGLHSHCLAEAHRLGEIWEAITSAKRAENYVTYRRRQLANLKEFIGDEDYYAGRFPPATPIWCYAAR